MILVGPHNYSSDSCGFDTISFNTFNMVAVITIVPVHSGLGRLIDLPEATQPENGELRI